MESFKQHHIEQALIETFLKLDEYLKLDEVNEFLYAVNFGNENDEAKYDKTENLRTNMNSQMQSFSNINNDNEYNRNPYKGNNNCTIVKFRGKYIRIDKNNNINYSNNSNSNNNNYSNKENLHPNINTLYNEDNNNIINNEDNFSFTKCPFNIAKEMGTTANILLISNNSLYLANCGDSLSVMYKNGQAVKLNQEHKTTLKSEYERIIKCGGQIINNRIEGKLNLTRAIGDLEFKNSPNLKFYEQSVTAYPEITKIKSLEGIEFIIMGCDGLWDCVEPQKLCESISRRLKDKEVKISSIISDVFDTILSKTNNTPIGTDNMSCVIIEFLNKQQQQGQND